MHDYSENPAVKLARYAAFLCVLFCAALGLGLLLDPASIHAQFSAPAASTRIPTGPLDAPATAATESAPATDFLAGLLTLAAAAYFFSRLVRWQAELNARAAARPYLERLNEFAAAIELASDTSALADILRDITATQHDAERQWLAGRLHTAHLQLLNQLHDTRARSANDKSQQLLLQALIEGGPVPANYHPAPAAPRSMQPAPTAPPTPYTPPAPAPVAAKPLPAVQEAPESADAPLASTQHRPEPAQPLAPSGIGQPRVRDMKDRGHRHQQPHQPQPHAAPDHVAPVHAAPTPPAAPVTAAAPAPVPRQLSEWEVEQKYQRGSDTITDFDSGIISPPRPRRKQGNLDAAAPAESRIEEDTDTANPPQLDLFGKGRQ